MSKSLRIWICILLISAFVLSTHADSPNGSQQETKPLEVLDALWKALQDNYPMMEYAGAFDDSWYEEAKSKIEGMTDLDQALPVMDALVRRLNDYHTRLLWRGKPRLFTPSISLGLVEERIAVLDREPGTPIDPGDVVLTIDSSDAKTRFDSLYPEAFGATRYARIRDDCRTLIERQEGSVVRLRLSNPTKGEYEVDLPCTVDPHLLKKPVLSSRLVEEDIGYIRILRWADFSPAEFDALLQEFRDIPFLILDVRDNGGGSDNLAAQVIGRFINRKVVCSVSFHRQPGTDQYRKTVEFAEPRGEWQYSGKTAVLTNAGCVSATEHFVSGMKEAGAILVGTPTSGACGWIRRIQLPGNVQLLCSRTFPLHGKVPSPLHGIEPNELVLPTLEALRTGRDEVLEKAIQVLKAK
ncbi:MAG: S41 family peptidase [bacterium]